MSKWKWFVKFPRDNVVTVSKDTPVNTVFTVNSEEILVLKDTPFGHKIAIKNIKKGSSIIKYGVNIGAATTDIKKGEHVHIHNVDEISLKIRDEEKRKSLQRS
jgi:altronate dehydratase